MTHKVLSQIATYCPAPRNASRLSYSAVNDFVAWAAAKPCFATADQGRRPVGPDRSGLTAADRPVLRRALITWRTPIVFEHVAPAPASWLIRL